MKKDKKQEIIEEISEEVIEVVKKLKKKLNKAKKEGKEYLDGWQRERADFVNYKKDIEKHIKESSERVKEEVLLQSITIVDNLELMMEHAHEAIIKSDWYRGVENAHTHAIQTLQGMGVEEIEVKKGDTFNPEEHEAVEGEGDVIKEVIQKGYKMGSKVLRPTQVKLRN